METKKLVIDADPGVDDAHAILMAFAHSGAKVEAITTVAGNVDLELTMANACTLLDALGVPPEQTPIFAGCDRALMGGKQRAIVHGKDGLGDAGFPRSARRAENEHAALALSRLANESPGELTLAAIGPLTNVALATRLDPTLPQKYKRLVVMGGAIRAMGNMPAPSTEFNIRADPEAAAIVFESWPGLWLLSWETTVQYTLSETQIVIVQSALTPDPPSASRSHATQGANGRGESAVAAKWLLPLSRREKRTPGEGAGGWGPERLQKWLSNSRLRKSKPW